MNKLIAYDIEVAIKAIIEEIAPNVGYVAKYGGEMILLDPSNERSIVGGIFEYRRHFALEFSEGASFKDPDGHLEGTGKNRRHLKFQYPEDVAEKDTASFLKQALKGA